MGCGCGCCCDLEVGVGVDVEVGVDILRVWRRGEWARARGGGCKEMERRGREIVIGVFNRKGRTGFIVEDRGEGLLTARSDVDGCRIGSG